MKNDKLSFLFLMLFLSMVFIHVPLSSVRTSRDTINIATEHTSHINAADSTTKIRVNVIADEAVEKDDPDTNFYINNHKGGLWVGYGPIDGITRSWLMFNISHLPLDIDIISASLSVYLNDEAATTDLPIAVHYSDLTNWTESTLTWNTQPSFNPTPSDVYDSGVSPDMFVKGNWYSWDITNDIVASLAGDKAFSLVIKQVDESSTDATWKYFMDKDYYAYNASYIEIEYTIPAASGITVDGASTSPQIDYIQNDAPSLAWQSNVDQDNYDLEVWNNEYFNDTLLMHSGISDAVTVSDAWTANNSRPFGVAKEMKYQMKFMSDILPRSGLIDKLLLGARHDGTAIFENLDIYMVNTRNDSALTNDFAGNYDGSSPINVLHRTEYTAVAKDGFLEFDIENTFFLDSQQNLIIEFRFTNNIGDLLDARIDYNSNGSDAYSWGPGSIVDDQANYVHGRLHVLDIIYASEPVMQVTTGFANFFPFGADSGHEGRMQFKYNASLFGETGFVDRLFFRTTTVGNPIFTDFTLKLVETPVLGPLNATDFSLNYGGVTPTTMISADVYVIPNHDGVLTIDLPDTFNYTGTHDLLIEMTWSDRIGASLAVYREIGKGGYRAYNVTYSSTHYMSQDISCLALDVAFTHPETSIVYSGSPFVNDTTYYLRVRTMNDVGIWSAWTGLAFTYAVLTSSPSWSALSYTNPAYTGATATFSIHVEYILGVNQVLLEIAGNNNTMTESGGTYTYDWVPSTVGNYTFTIYMESSIGTWSTTSGDIEVLQSTTTTTTTTPAGTTIPSSYLLIIAIAVIVVIIIVVLKRRK